MRTQFFRALQERCLLRSNRSSPIRWWFSRVQVPARRIGVDFADEPTRPFGMDPHTPTTLEDPPLAPEFWARLNVG